MKKTLDLRTKVLNRIIKILYIRIRVVVEGYPLENAMCL